MARSRRPAPPRTPEEAAELIQQYAVKMIDKGDGHGADWAVVAQLLFRASFAVADKLRDDPRMASVLRRVEAGLYDRLAGNEAEPLAAPASLSADPAAPQPSTRGPNPRLRP